MRTISFLICIKFAFICGGQSADSVYHPLQEVTIIGNRLNTNLEISPFAITKIDSLLINQPLQQLSIKEQLIQVPGVFIQNAYNFAQDARISIRGFGANAAFGIRGIKLIVDGIPETTPDGTGQLDNLNLDQIGRIQVIRGASSSLYGNASGGTILLNSPILVENNLMFQSMIGSYGFRSQSLAGGIKTDKASYQANIRYFESQGYRNHSKFSQVNGRFASHQQFSKKVSAVIVAEYVSSPQAQDAGGLTLEETEADFKQARDRNLTFDAGESISQWKIGSSLKWQLSDKSTLNTYTFYNSRKFDGKLPFESSGIIALERDYSGIGNSLAIKTGVHSIQAGYDLFLQSDSRLRFDNLNGTQGAPVFDQKESFLNTGFYLIDHIKWNSWSFSGGLRFDLNELKVNDRFILNGDDSGSINMNNWSYQAGIARTITPGFQLFANHATSFETPTLIQLSNRPDNLGGFEDLEAATTNNLEVGLRWRKEQLNAELVAFTTQTQGELLPYELEAFPERTFYSNTGKTSRKGLEFATSYKSPILSINASFTLSDFTFGDYDNNGVSLSGFRLPGLPRQFGNLNLIFHPTDRLNISIPIQYVGSLWAENQNETLIEAYMEVSLISGYSMSIAQISVEPFLGIRNLTDQKYFDNIRINAFGGRYYEPAPGRNFYGGIKVKI